MPFTRADKAKVAELVAFLDAGIHSTLRLPFPAAHRACPSCAADGNGMMDAQEVKVLIAKITGIPKEAIGDNHPEVIALVSLLHWLKHVQEDRHVQFGRDLIHAFVRWLH